MLNFKSINVTLFVKFSKMCFVIVIKILFYYLFELVRSITKPTLQLLRDNIPGLNLFHYYILRLIEKYRNYLTLTCGTKYLYQICIKVFIFNIFSQLFLGGYKRASSFWLKKIKHNWLNSYNKWICISDK